MLLAGEVPPGLRQLAATVLKNQLVKEHWTPEAPQYRGPPVGDAERAAIREALPQGLGDESSLVRTAAAMAVAAIARWDCPQAWPELIPGLVQAITAKKNASLGAPACWGPCWRSEQQLLRSTPAGRGCCGGRRRLRRRFGCCG